MMKYHLRPIRRARSRSRAEKPLNRNNAGNANPQAIRTHHQIFPVR